MKCRGVRSTCCLKGRGSEQAKNGTDMELRGRGRGLEGTELRQCADREGRRKTCTGRAQTGRGAHAASMQRKDRGLPGEVYA